MVVHDVAFVGKRFKNVMKASSLILLYQTLCDENNDISATKNQIIEIYEKIFDVKLSRRTLSDWIKSLAENGVIKFKYSGSARLNPFFYYNGQESNYDNVLNQYKNFKSDIKECSNSDD